MNDMELARFNMIEQQIRPWNVLDGRVLELLKKLRREQFVPADQQALAFMDTEIPLGLGASMWHPRVEARALQALQIKPTDRVLEVGTGSGYLTALLAQLAQHVTSVEIQPELSERAARNLADQPAERISLHVGDAACGWAGEYDVIVLTGSTPLLPEEFQDALKIGGRLFAIVGDAPMMQAKRLTCVAPGTFDCDVLFEACVAPLQNARQPERFSF